MINVSVTILIFALVASGATAETTNENGYGVTRSQTVVPVPRGKVGNKTIYRETRTGTTEETDGNSSNYTMTLGGFMNRCPVLEGNAPVKFVVPGDFEYSIVADTVDTHVVPTVRKHYEKHVTARITIFVNDDMTVTEGEINGEFTSDIDGVRTGPVPIRRRFPIRAYGTPDFDALMDVVRVTGDVAVAALMWNASTTIVAVQLEWREPNACTELQSSRRARAARWRRERPWRFTSSTAPATDSSRFRATAGTQRRSARAAGSRRIAARWPTTAHSS